MLADPLQRETVSNPEDECADRATDYTNDEYGHKCFEVFGEVEIRTGLNPQHIRNGPEERDCGARDKRDNGQPPARG